MRRVITLMGGLLFLCVGTGANCARAQAPVAAKPASADDKNSSPLAKEVHHQLLMLPYCSVFDNLGFSIEGNKVILYGQVVRPSLKQNAEAEVKSIEGIDVVVNRIEVLPISQSDDELRRSVYRSIFEDSTLSRYAVQAVPSIHIIVKNARTMLLGVVDNASDRQLAEVRAREVTGVFEVENGLIVAHEAEEGSGK